MSKLTKALSLFFTNQDNWKQRDGALLGRCGGHWFTLTQNNPLQPVIITVSVSDLTYLKLEDLKAHFNEGKTEFKMKHFSVNNNVLSFVLPVRFPYEALSSTLASVLVFLSDILNKSDINDGCFLCAAYAKLNTVCVNDTLMTVCDDCIELTNKIYEDAQNKSKAEGSYFTGFIGALLGTLFGIALWLAVSYFGYYASIIGFVMALSANFGYKLFKGRRDRAMPYIILINIFIGIILANLFEIALAFVLDPEYALGFIDALLLAPLAFFDAELFYVGKVWGNVAISLLFALLGSWKLIKSLYTETRSSYNKLEII
jgi:hypothetical protein